MSSKLDDKALEVTLLKELESFLECNVCWYVPYSSPIYQCDNGHLLCKECYKKLSYCPCCRALLSKIRNRFAEKVQDKIPMKCKFAGYGCKEILPRKDLPSHAKECVYREVVCPNYYCGERVSLASIVEHLLSMHWHFGKFHQRIPTDVSMPLGKKLRNTIEIILHPPFASEEMWDESFQMNGVYFSIQVNRIDNPKKASGNWFIWIYAGITINDCERFLCDLRIINDGNEEVLSKIGPVVSLDVDRLKVYEGDGVLAFSESVSKRFTKSDSLIISFSLKQIRGRING